MTLLLLFGAGLFVRTLRNLQTVDVGFTTDHLVKFAVDPELAGYAPIQTAALYPQVLGKLQSLPGVRSAAATTDAELSDTNWRQNITIAGYDNKEIEDKDVEWERVSAGYCSTLGLPLIAGREINDQDRERTQKVAVVSESLTRRYFAKPQDAIGHYFGPGAGQVETDIEIVGMCRSQSHGR
jgi:hypothetical protein